MAALLGLPCRIFVPFTITKAAQAAIAGEGADLTVLDQPYDEVVKHASEHASDLGAKSLLVQDSSWPGLRRRARLDRRRLLDPVPRDG